MGVPLSLIQSNQEGFIKEIFSNILKDKERWHDKKKAEENTWIFVFASR